MLILQSVTFMLATFIFFSFLSRKSSLDFFVISFFLNLYHFIFSIFYYLFFINKPNDSINYYNWAVYSLSEFNFSSGTGFVVYFVRFLDLFLNEYLHVYLFFSSISSLAILFFFKLIYELYKLGKLNKNGFLLLTILLFIPGIHFWTVAIGKDGLVLFFITIFLYSYYNRFLGLLFISLIFLSLIRIHVFAVLFLSFMVNEFVYGNYKFKKMSMGIYRVIIMILTIPAFLMVYNLLFSFMQKYSDTGFSSFGDFVDNRNEVYSSEGSGIILSSQPYIFKILAFILGGLPWLSMDLMTIISMIEGILVFLLISYLLINYFNIIKRNSQQNFVLLFIIILVSFMPIISVNLGIMVRMRVMLYMPVFFILLNFFIDKQKVKLRS